MSAQILVAFSDPQPAHLLVSYLNSQQVKASHVTVEGPHTHGVSVNDPAQLELARRLTEEFVRNPADPKYQQAAWSNGRPGAVQRGALLGNIQRFSLRQNPVTLTVLGLCVLVYLLSVFSGFVPVLQVMLLTPLAQLADSHQWWRVVTPALIHFSALHLVFNVLWWWTLGSRIERIFGSSMLLLLFFSSAVISNLAQLVMSGPQFGGLSGVVYAVLGFVWWCGWLRPSWGLHLPPAMVGFMLIWMLLGFADVLWVSMANTAHLMGLVSGCGAAWVLHKTSNRG